MAILYILLTLLTSVWAQQQYRHDYSWVESAGGWMKYHAVPAVWEEARLRCHAEGSVLASPLNNTLWKAIMKFAVKHDARTLFIGVHCKFSKGDYSSIEGVPLRRLAITWVPEEPDNRDNLESCLAMTINEQSKGGVFDTRCGDVLPYVCYKKNTTITLNVCGTTDPGYVYEPQTGSCYKFHRSGLRWSEAYSTCMGEGGYLAIIDNEDEAAAIRDILQRYPENQVIGHNGKFINIGFNDWGHYGSNYMTIHGESLEDKYMVWRRGEPNNSSRPRVGDQGEFCGSVTRAVELNDQVCNMPTAFLCEMEPYNLQ